MFVYHTLAYSELFLWFISRQSLTIKALINVTLKHLGGTLIRDHKMKYIHGLQVATSLVSSEGPWTRAILGRPYL